MRKMRSEDELGEELNGYVSLLEEEVERGMKIVWVGGDGGESIEGYREE